MQGHRTAHYSLAVVSIHLQWAPTGCATVVQRLGNVNVCACAAAVPQSSMPIQLGSDEDILVELELQELVALGSTRCNGHYNRNCHCNSKAVLLFYAI
eukprot:13974-Heterococcus_DN1.PRE.2